MRRFGIAWLVVILLCLTATVAEARHFHRGHHHHHWGHHHHHWGHRHWHGYGWGGYGYRPWGGVSISVGLGRPYYGYAWPNYGYGWSGYRPYDWGYYGAYYSPAVYRSYYYSGPVWPTYDYYYPSSYYYYPSSYYFYPSSYYYGYPVYGYPTWSYFGSTSSVKPTNFVLRKPEEPAPATTVPSATERTEVTVVRSSIDDRSRARQLVRLGDEAFRNRRYVDALSRYRNAVERAPELAEAHFRKGHAYLANGQYSLAATSFREALRLEPNARRDGFKLNDLYGKGSVAKDTHIENLAAVALTRDDPSDAYFLLGLMLHFDGQTSRAEKFFAKAASLSPETREAVASFLPVETTEPVSLELGDEI